MTHTYRPTYLPRYAPGTEQPRWLVLAVGDLAPRVAWTEETARRWARNLGGALVTHPDGTEETIRC